MSLQVALELGDATLDAATVDLELRLARTAGADAGAARRRHAAGLLRQLLAPAAQARQPVAQQRQLDLGLALLARGVLGEDVEDHRGAVDGRAPEQLLEVVLLRRRQLVVEDDRVAVDLEADLAQLLGLALADVVRGVGRVAALHDAGDLVGAGGVDQLRQLVERRVDVVGRRVAEGDADEDDLLPEGPLDELVTACGYSTARDVGDRASSCAPRGRERSMRVGAAHHPHRRPGRRPAPSAAPPRPRRTRRCRRRA